MSDAPSLDHAGPRQQPEAALGWLAAIVASSDDAIISANAEQIITTWNPGAELLYGYPAAEAIGQPFTLLIPPDRVEELSRLLERLQRGERIEHMETVRRRKDGRMIDISIGMAPILDAAGHVLGSAAIARDITERKRIDRELGVRTRQQAVVAELSQRALASDDLSTLLDEAVALIAHTLELEHCTILELVPDGTALRFRAGVGWRDGVVGQALVPTGPRSQAGYTLETGGPVLVEDMREEQRFQPNALLLEHGIVSGISVPVPGQERPFGVLSMHARQVRPFTADDVHFLEATANVLAAAIKRTSTERQLREKEAQYRSIFEATTDGLAISDLDTDAIVEVNPAFCTMHGYTRAEMIGAPLTRFIHPDSQHLYLHYLQTVSAGAEYHAQAWQVRKDGTPFPIEVHGTAFMYQGKRHGLGLVRDVSEQVHAYQLLERRVAERTQELSTLLDVSHHVASTLELEPLLGLILAQLSAVVDYTAACVFIVEGDHVRMLDYRGPLPREQMVEVRIPLTRAVGYQAVLRHDGPVIVDDLLDRGSLAEAFQGYPAYLKATLLDARSLLVVPLKVKERLIGVVRIDHHLPRAYTPQQANLAMAIANQAAMAIENARLYARAQDTATLEERQRLARELHDSVTQALYGVTLYAEAAASTLAAGDLETATSYLLEVRNTAHDALQEMRLLIFELRPSILEQEGLAAALQARLAAVEGRTAGLTTHIAVDGALRLPARVEEALYRIAQEALNNVAKHAHACAVTVSLRCAGPTVQLEIADDGTGFVAAGRGGGVGLHSMQERAALIGARLTVESTPGQGAVVRVEVPHA